jgi:hypothetical protein
LALIIIEHLALGMLVMLHILKFKLHCNLDGLYGVQLAIKLKLRHREKAA